MDLKILIFFLFLHFFFLTQLLHFILFILPCPFLPSLYNFFLSLFIHKFANFYSWIPTFFYSPSPRVKPFSILSFPSFFHLLVPIHQNIITHQSKSQLSETHFIFSSFSFICRDFLPSHVSAKFQNIDEWNPETMAELLLAFSS